MIKNRILGTPFKIKDSAVSLRTVRSVGFVVFLVLDFSVVTLGFSCFRFLLSH